MITGVHAALPGVPVLVVDDGSTDGTGALAHAAGAWVIEGKGNQGKGVSTGLDSHDAVLKAFEIAVGYDGATDRILVVANEVAEEDDEEEEQAESAPPAQPDPAAAAAARFSITRPQAAAFVLRAQALMQGGRPVCPLCSQPKDPEGHVCPRANGHIVR